MPINPAEIYAQARLYVGTPFRHLGRPVDPRLGKPHRGGHFIDCIGLLLCVAEDLHLDDKLGAPIRRCDYAAYAAQPMDDFLHAEIARRLPAKAAGTAIAPGDLLTLRIPRSTLALCRVNGELRKSVISHFAFVSVLNGAAASGAHETRLGIIHAYPPPTVGRVVETGFDPKWTSRVAGVFTFPG